MCADVGVCTLHEAWSHACLVHYATMYAWKSYWDILEAQ